MDSIVVACETCGQRFKAPAAAVGRQTTCGFCGGAMEIRPAGDAEYSPSGFVDLSDPAAEDRAGADAPAAPARRETGSRARATLFDAASGAPELPRRGEARSGGTGRKARGDTGRRGPPPAENLRASGARRGDTAALRRSGIARAPSSARTTGARPMP